MIAENRTRGQDKNRNQDQEINYALVKGQGAGLWPQEWRFVSSDKILQNQIVSAGIIKEEKRILDLIQSSEPEQKE